MEKDSPQKRMAIVRKRPHFFYVVYSAGSSKRLKIPDKFVKYMEGMTSGLVSLEGPSGDFWHVSLVQEGGDFCINKGWPTFVSDHSVLCGDLLIFRYDGDSNFSVQIFEQSACEKETAFQATCSQDLSSSNGNMTRKRQIDEVLPLRMYDAASKKMKTISGSRLVCNGKEGGVEDLSTDEYYTRENVVTAMPLQICNERFDIKDNLMKHEDWDLPMLKLSSTAEERRIARSFNSSFPCFVRIMKKFNVGGSYTLNIPYKFSMEHLPNCKLTVTLCNLKGERWTVNSVPTTKVHTSHTLCGGWMAFVRANGIELEDVCIFELVQKFEMRVHIHGDRKAAHSPEDCESIKRNKTNVNPQVLIDCSTNKKGSGSEASRLKSETKDCSTSMLSVYEEKVARSFKSSFPNFVRVMKRFNISGSYTLKVPYQFAMAHLPQCKTEIVLRNQKGECWTVNSVPDSMGRMSHTFCGGWSSFVHDNDITIGDTCIFELVEKFEMRVHIDHGNEATGSKTMIPAKNEAAGNEHGPLRVISGNGAAGSKTFLQSFVSFFTRMS